MIPVVAVAWSGRSSCGIDVDVRWVLFGWCWRWVYFVLGSSERCGSGIVRAIGVGARSFASGIDHDVTIGYEKRAATRPWWEWITTVKG